MSLFTRKPGSSLGLTVLVGALCLVLGIYLGFLNRPEVQAVTGLIDKTNGAIEEKTDFSTFWKVWNLINEKSPIAEKVSNQDRVYGAIEGLVNSLGDPYTVFFPPEESKLFQETVNGEFGGIGIEVGIKDKILTVITALKDTPAYKAGLKSGDKIIKINDKVTTDLSLDESINLIRGEKGTQVTLSVFREGDEKPRSFTLTRETISMPTLDTETKPGGITIIRLYQFSPNSADLFADAIEKLMTSGNKKLVIDLRGNPGGYLDAAVDMASWFIPEGKPVVSEDFGIKQEPEVNRSRGYNGPDSSYKILVLVDSGSASASEILAGALQDHGIAKLVGEQTFGKGSVQEVIDITKDTSLKITIAKWLTPKGTSISEHGLTPDYIVKNPEDIKNGKDLQLEKALELLK